MKQTLGRTSFSANLLLGAYCIRITWNNHLHEIEHVIDVVMLNIILLNAVFVGIAVELQDTAPVPIQILNIIFAAVFWLELIVKISLSGFRNHFCGADLHMIAFIHTLYMKAPQICHF